MTAGVLVAAAVLLALGAPPVAAAPALQRRRDTRAAHRACPACTSTTTRTHTATTTSSTTSIHVWDSDASGALGHDCGGSRISKCFGALRGRPEYTGDAQQWECHTGGGRGVDRHTTLVAEFEATCGVSCLCVTAADKPATATTTTAAAMTTVTKVVPNPTTNVWTQATNPVAGAAKGYTPAGSNATTAATAAWSPPHTRDAATVAGGELGFAKGNEGGSSVGNCGTAPGTCTDACGWFFNGTWCKSKATLTMLRLQYTGHNFNDLGALAYKLPMKPDGTPKIDVGKLRIDTPGPRGAEWVSYQTSLGINGMVRIGETFTLSPSGEFPGDLVVRLMGLGVDTTVMFHSSCSYPIEVGDQYGSLKIIGHSNSNGCSATTPARAGAPSVPAATKHAGGLAAPPPTTAATTTAATATTATAITITTTATTAATTAATTPTTTTVLGSGSKSTYTGGGGNDGVGMKSGIIIIIVLAVCIFAAFVRIVAIAVRRSTAPKNEKYVTG